MYRSLTIRKVLIILIQTEDNVRINVEWRMKNIVMMAALFSLFCSTSFNYTSDEDVKPESTTQLNCGDKDCTGH